MIHTRTARSRSPQQSPLRCWTLAIGAALSASACSGGCGFSGAHIADTAKAQSLPPNTDHPQTQAQAQAQANDFHPPGFELLFEETFDGDELPRRDWCTRYIYGGGPPAQLADPDCTPNGEGTSDYLNDEVQRYRDFDNEGRPLHKVNGGVLTLLARHHPNGTPPYTAGMIRSKRTFKPSPTSPLYITARVKLPAIRGTWPAFWLNSDRDSAGKLTWPPEIDIFEGALNMREDDVNSLHFGLIPRPPSEAVIYHHPQTDLRWHNMLAPHSLRDRWLEVAVEWHHDRVCHVVDGQQMLCQQFEWVRKDKTAAPPAHILLNLAIGGEWAGRYGIDSAAFPARFEVDHVRVYQRALAPQP